MNIDPTEHMQEPERAAIRAKVIAQADPPPPVVRYSNADEVVEVWAHGPVVRYKRGEPHPSGKNRHERRAAAAKARR